MPWQRQQKKEQKKKKITKTKFPYLLTNPNPKHISMWLAKDAVLSLSLIKLLTYARRETPPQQKLPFPHLPLLSSPPRLPPPRSPASPSSLSPPMESQVLVALALSLVGGLSTSIGMAPPPRASSPLNSFVSGVWMLLCLRSGAVS